MAQPSERFRHELWFIQGVHGNVPDERRILHIEGSIIHRPVPLSGMPQRRGMGVVLLRFLMLSLKRR